MRVADTMVFEQTRENLGKNRSQMADLQNKSATQKRVTKPSDDPVAAARVLKTRVEISGQDQFVKSLDLAKSFLEYTDQSISELSDLLIRAKELALGQASDASANAQSRKVVGTEVQQLFQQAVNVGNRKLGDRYIFGGSRTTKPPFNHKGAYTGNVSEMRIHVDKSSFIPMNLPGSMVFLGENINHSGHNDLEMKQQPTTIEEYLVKRDGQLPENSSESDENAEQVQLRGPASLRTPEVDSNKYKNDPKPEDLPQGQADFTDGIDGKNVFSVLKNLEISLMANDKFGVQESLEELDDAIEQVVLARAQVGSRVNSLDKISENLTKAKLDNQALSSRLEDADIYKLVSDISKTESALQATLNTSGKILQPSLLDFLR